MVGRGKFKIWVAGTLAWTDATAFVAPGGPAARTTAGNAKATIVSIAARMPNHP
jgi:hypothetical protein